MLTTRPGRAARHEVAGRAAHHLLQDAAVPLAVWLAGAMVFFRAVWSSGFDHLTGNDGDTRLIAFICEHWFAVLHGNGSIRNMPFFYPVKGLLGWSDSFFLYVPLYAPLRELGCGPMLALQLTQILLSLIGFLSFYFLVRRWTGAARWMALAGASAFTFANGLYLHVASTQLSGVYLVPLVLLAAGQAWDRARSDRRRAAAWGCLAGVLFGLLFFTCYYVALFSALAGVIAGFWVVVLSGRRTIHFLSEAARQWSAWARPAAFTVGGFLIAAVPVAVVYLPARSAIGPVTSRTVLAYAINWRGLADVGASNLVWSSLLRSLDHTPAFYNYESTYAATPGMALALVAAAVWAIARRRRDPDGPPGQRLAVLALAMTALTLWLLPVKLHSQSAWLLLRPIPGVDAIRGVDRIAVVGDMVAVLALVAAAATADRTLGALRRTSRRPPLVASAVLIAAVGFVVVEQYDTGSVAQVDRIAQDRFVASIRPAPAGCRYFFVVDQSDPSLPFYESQIDAMLVAQKVGVPTINGYTGYNPKGWNLESIGDPSYLPSVLSWEAQEGLGAGACQLDLGTMAWARAPS